MKHSKDDLDGQKGIAPRPGMFEHHDAECVMVSKGEHSYVDSYGSPHRKWWCETHNQWAYETPTDVTWTWQDGTVTDMKL